MKVRIEIVREAENRYRALIKIGYNPKPTTNKKIVYTSCKETGQEKILYGSKIGILIEELKEAAKKWARQEGIRYVANLDPDPYP
jgi:predicted TIM-barrel fold metal-dependent hydrolase